MPATPGIRAVAHLSEEHGFVGMATAGEASGTVQKEFCRTVEAYGGDGAFDDLLENRAFTAGRIVERRRVAGIESGIEMQPDLMAESDGQIGRASCGTEGVSTCRSRGAP